MCCNNFSLDLATLPDHKTHLRNKTDITWLYSESELHEIYSWAIMNRKCNTFNNHGVITKNENNASTTIVPK